jgi:hypothetical protein
MPFLVRAFPLVRPLEEAHRFLAELAGPRRADTDQFYARYGIVHESAYLQDTPNGAILIVVTLIKDAPEAGTRYSAAAEAFEIWFKGEVFRLTGVNPDEQPLGPPTTELFKWSCAADPTASV